MIWCNEMARDYRMEKGLAEGARYDQDDLSAWLADKVGFNKQLSLF